MPFLEKLRQELSIPADRLIPITRGGAGAWYRTPKALELYQMRSVQDVRVENRLQFAQHAMMKQTRVTPFDAAILRDAAETLQLGRKYHVLHPAWMYQLLTPFWQEKTGLQWLLRHAAFADLPVPPLDIALPPSFVAVRFYFRTTLPMNDLTVSFAREALKQVAHKTPVVLLNSGLVTDDHVDWDAKTLPANVVRLTDLVPITPENNLAVQSVVLARALGFVGTYGGLAQLALRLKKPSVSVYLHWQGTALAHATLSRAVGLVTGVPFNVIGVNELPMLQESMPLVAYQPPVVQKGLDTAQPLAHA